MLLAPCFALAQQWDKYVPKNKRKEAVKDCAKATGMGMVFSGQAALTLWISEPAARVLVSQAIDKERITNQEADEKYLELRPQGVYLFLLDARRITSPAFGRTSAKSLADPLARKELFLQRAGDTKHFSKGEVRDHDFDVNLGGLLGGGDLASTYYITFPKRTRDEQPLITSLSDKIEIQFVISGKKVVLEYKVKDVVTRLEDL